MIKFEEKIDCINKLIQKNRGKWHLSDMAGFSFEDIAQIIRIHIFKKWALWDQKRPFECWCNAIIVNQIKNCVRDIYSKDAPPCSKCPFDRGGELCGYTNSGTKCSECPAYKKWSKKKQTKFLLKTATSIDTDYYQDTQDYTDPSIALKVEASIPKFHKFMLEILPQKQATFYTLMYIKNLNDEEVISRLKEINGKGITKRQLFVIRKNLQEIAKSKISEFDPDHDS